jgi:hypothetical protein
MKKLFTIFIVMLFVSSLSFAIGGCKKAEEKAVSTTEAVTGAAKDVQEVVTDAAESVAPAQDFGWFTEFNVRAKANMPEFENKLAKRFNISVAEVKNAIMNTKTPSEAYMSLRLIEISHKSSQEVVDAVYAEQGRSWVKIAKRLDIDTKSPEFKALMEGHDLDKVKS